MLLGDAAQGSTGFDLLSERAVSPHDAALGSRPGCAYLEHKQNIRSGCRSLPHEALVCRAQEVQAVSLSPQGHRAAPMSTTAEQIATLLARYGEPAEGN